MPFYLFQASYHADQVKAMVGNPQDRSEAARKLIEGMGGKLQHLFFSFGEYDIAAIIEVPDNASMAAGSLAVAAVGTTSKAKTTVLLTTDEAQAAMGKACTATGYLPPSG